MRITFWGDVMATREQMQGYARGGGYRFPDALRGVRKQMGESDYNVVNLETPIAGEALSYTCQNYSFNTPVELAEALRQCGVDLVTTANNHCLDRGVEGLRNTIRLLDSCGLEHLGTHDRAEPSYLIKEIGGIKVGFLAFTYGTNAFDNHIYLGKSQRYLVDLLQRQELANPVMRRLWTSGHICARAVRKVMRRLRKEQWSCPVYERREGCRRELAHYRQTIRDCRRAGAEYVISCLHIGGQYNERPTRYTKDICLLSKKWGVDAVVAGHEHVIQEVEVDAADRGGSPFLCVYSLGNLLSSSGVTSGPYDKMAQYSIAVHIDLERNGRQETEARYSFTLYHSILDAEGMVVSVPFEGYGEQGEACRKEHQALLNRIYQTENITYPISGGYSLQARK